MTITALRTPRTLLSLAVAVGLSGCNSDPTPEVAAPQEETEAGAMADDAVSLAENAMESAAITDADVDRANANAAVAAAAAADANTDVLSEPVANTTIDE